MNDTLPARIARLEKDKRGYPIPWNVLRREGTNEPVFIVNDDVKSLRAIREHLCPICGEKLGKWHWFVGGPKSAFDPHGWYIDLPGHHECVTFALQTCPYLAMPGYMGRKDYWPDPKGIAVPLMRDDNPTLNDRPEVFVAVASDRVELQRRSGAGNLAILPYVRPARPYLDYEFWRHGQRLTEAEGVLYARLSLGADWEPPKRREEG